MTFSEGPVVFDPADFGAIPGSKELRRWMRKVRRGKADRTFWQQFESIYLVIFTVVMLKVLPFGYVPVLMLGSFVVHARSVTCRYARLRSTC